MPTEACEALLPSLISLGEWGLIWARHNVLDADLDVEFLIFYLERSIDPARLIGSQSVIQFKFKDLTEQQDWWLLVRDETVDLCLTYPGRDFDVFFRCTLRTMHDLWMGDRSYAEAMKSGDLIVEAEPALMWNIKSWLRPIEFAESPRAASPLD